MFHWKEVYSVGIAALDRQHRSLFATMNELDAALAEGNGQDVIERVLEILVAYTSQHFADEEALMAQHNFPELESHRAEHQAARKKVLAFEADFKLGKKSTPVGLLLFLEGWLKNHILKTDKAYSSFLNERGVH